MLKPTVNGNRKSDTSYFKSHVFQNLASGLRLNQSACETNFYFLPSQLVTIQKKRHCRESVTPQDLTNLLSEGGQSVRALFGILRSRGQQIKLVKKFKYLGYMITSDGKCITEIKKRIATAKDAFQKLSLILKNRNISMTTKFRVLKTYVWSTLTYGCECWTITSDIEKKIEAAEMWFIRRMLRISWAEKKTNVNVLREGNVQRSLLKTIRKRQMEFLGHVCRRRGLEFLSLTGKVEGKRDRGKQRITFLDSLCNSATGGQSKGLNFLKLSDDRDVWRGMVANVCSRSGT